MRQVLCLSMVLCDAMRPGIIIVVKHTRYNTMIIFTIFVFGGKDDGHAQIGRQEPNVYLPE
jgi:hypothetical protein